MDNIEKKRLPIEFEDKWYIKNGGFQFEEGYWDQKNGQPPDAHL